MHKEELLQALRESLGVEGHMVKISPDGVKTQLI